MADGPTAHGGGRGTAEPLRVTILGPDPVLRRRLALLLTDVDGIEVAGCAESPETTAVPHPHVFVAVGAPAAPDGWDPPGTRSVPLAKRQRDVLIAYTASNDLITVLARQIGMTPETFRTHLRRVRAKYEKAGRPAPTRRDLYVRAVEDGLVPPPS